MSACSKYGLPIPQDLLQRIDRTSSPAHVGRLRNAIDLIAPQNTLVFAAADGVVTLVKDDSNIGGPEPSYWIYVNFISIMHSNGGHSRYDHLEYGISKAMVGQQVKEGQEIARVGMTGYTYIPHLHFQVFVLTWDNVWTDYNTIEVKDFIYSQ